MTAYCIGHLKYRDTAFLAEYAAKSEALIAKHGGEMVAYGSTDVLEGAIAEDEMTVIIRFPSVDAARAWYDDPEYAPLIALRQSNSDTTVVIVEAAE